MPDDCCLILNSEMFRRKQTETERTQMAACNTNVRPSEALQRQTLFHTIPVTAIRHIICH